MEEKKNFLYTILVFILSINPMMDAFPQLTDWQNYTNGDWVFNIMDDGDYLWIGTGGGLVKMDKSTEEKTFYNRANAGLPDNRILSLAKDKDGNIWLGSKYSGVGCFDGQKCKVYNERNSGIEYEQYCTAIAIDAEGNKWIGTLFYLNKFDGKKWQSWTTPGSDIISSIWNIYSMKFDKNGVLWLGGTGGWSFAKFTGTEIQVLFKGNDVHGIEIDDNDNKWLATNSALIKYTDEDSFHYTKENSGLPCNRFIGITKDNKNNLWIAGEGGYLIKYDGNEFTSFNMPFKREGDWITCIGTDGENVWIGTRYEGMFKFKDGVFSQIRLSNSPLPTNDISSCADIDNENSIWIGTEYNLVEVDKNNNWNSHYQKFKVTGKRRITGMNYSDKEDLWVAMGQSDTCVLKINRNDTVAFTKENTPLFEKLSLFSDPETFSAFAFDKKGNTWLASRVGLFKYDGEKWGYYSPDNSPLPIYQINALAIDKEDNLWVNSATPDQGGGLCKYDGKSWIVYTTRNSGLSTPFVATMAFDSKNVLWLNCRDTTLFGLIGRTSGGGLTRFDGKSWQSYNISNSKIPSNSILDIVVDKNDDLWLATYGRVGITKFDGTDWESYNTENSGIAWDEVSKITLDYNRDLIWLNHLNSGGISTAKLNWKGSGIEEKNIASSPSFSIYPNPARDIIHFRFPAGTIPEKLEIYDVSGKLIGSKKLKSMSCNLSELNIRQKGLYLLKATDSDYRVYVSRLLVE